MYFQYSSPILVYVARVEGSTSGMYRLSLGTQLKCNHQSGRYAKLSHVIDYLTTTPNTYDCSPEI